MKRLICSAAVATALLALTAIPSGAVTTTCVSFPCGFGNNPAVALTDTVDFTLGSSERVTISGNGFLIPDLSLSLNTSPTTPVPVSFPTPFGTAVPVFDLSTLLAAGSYILTIAGTGSSMIFPGPITLTSSYAGSVAVSPVPLPGSLVLFASGMGLLGLWGWTKRRKTGLGSTSLEAAAC